MRPTGSTASVRPAASPSGVVFRKRVYDLPGLVRDVRGLRPVVGSAWTIYGRRRIDPAFRERIMVAVAEVSECRFCSYAHHEWALTAGVEPSELDPMGGLDGDPRDPREATAIAYVQVRAEADFAPAPAAVEARFVEVFTPPERRDIETTARIMRIFNLAANTVDALHARRRGETVEGPLLHHLVIGAVTLPLIALVVTALSFAKGERPSQGWRDLQEFSVAFDARGDDGQRKTTAAPAAAQEAAPDRAQREVALR